MTSLNQVLRVLKLTSRTFYLPVIRLPEKLQEGVAAAYLCMRAIDEIEDHPDLDNMTKYQLLTALSQAIQAQISLESPYFAELPMIFKDYANNLPEVTRRLGDWLNFAPRTIAPRIMDSVAAMASRMAYWVQNNWEVKTKADLDAYTFSVAGAVGLLLCDIWTWFDGSQIDRNSAIYFGRGLQSVNILRNRREDLARQVDFFPLGWTVDDMFAYARDNLDMAKKGVQHMPRQAYKYFVEIPLLLAEATLDALARGEEKLSRREVLAILQQVG